MCMLVLLLLCQRPYSGKLVVVLPMAPVSSLASSALASCRSSVCSRTVSACVQYGFGRWVPLSASLLSAASLFWLTVCLYLSDPRGPEAGFSQIFVSTSLD
ncbi:unnamed protein product [Prorocentrum cordatum]|uniref:Secreted protein n=1 Tax=Prorocentrum cordatum TaxID=2364126 RepID=A0ABN9V1R3_9DINO|nr:unnamed protein product [Polarella glacialis]